MAEGDHRPDRNDRFRGGCWRKRSFVRFRLPGFRFIRNGSACCLPGFCFIRNGKFFCLPGFRFIDKNSSRSFREKLPWFFREDCRRGRCRFFRFRSDSRNQEKDRTRDHSCSQNESGELQLFQRKIGSGPGCLTGHFGLTGTGCLQSCGFLLTFFSKYG